MTPDPCSSAAKPVPLYAQASCHPKQRDRRNQASLLPMYRQRSVKINAVERFLASTTRQFAL
jgi:hypothetical protein